MALAKNLVVKAINEPRRNNYTFGGYPFNYLRMMVYKYKYITSGDLDYLNYLGSNGWLIVSADATGYLLAMQFENKADLMRHNDTTLGFTKWLETQMDENA